jgi:hypothetical protein
LEVVAMKASDVRVHVGQGTVRGSLTAFPVWTDAPSVPRRYLTGVAAAVDVAERAGSPVVEELVVTNRGDSPALLLCGELLEGGWQTRALAGTTLLAPGRPTVQPVVCVEQGRWSGGAAHARRARRAPLGVMRELHSQHEVWNRVRGYADVAGDSPTESLADRLDVTAPRARDLTRGLRPLAGQRGVLIGIAGQPVWLELFDSGRSLAAHWSALLHAATMDALGRPEVRTPAALARSFAERVERTRLAPAGPAGLASRVSGGGRVSVDAVRWSDRTIHLTAVASEA